MRCVSCDEPLSPKEESMKSEVTGQDFLMCIPCLQQAGVLHQAVENPIAEDDVYLDISGLQQELNNPE